MGTPSKSLTEKEEEIKEEYLKTLQDLTFNSKPLIDVLTEVAEENKEFASTIADCIVEQLEKVADHLKLPILYLIDSIIKNIGQHYMFLFCRSIDRLFTKVYEQGDENVRSRLLKLRFTWNGILPLKVLSSLDKMVQAVNPSWPNAPLVHVNPKFVSISTTHVTSPNGNGPQTASTFKIAPASAQLVNAVRRVRDPRLRKNELQQIRVPNNNTSSSSISKEAKTTTSSQIDPKIDQKNDKRQRLDTKETIVNSKCEPKEAARRRVEVKVVQERPRPQTSVDIKASKMKADISKMAKKKEKAPKISELFNQIVNHQEESKEKPINKKWTKEERDKGLRTIANALSEDKDRDKVIENLSKNYPNIAQKLLKLMKTGKGDSPDEKNWKHTGVKTVPKISVKSSPPKRDKTASPKPSSGVVSTPAVTTPIVVPVPATVVSRVPSPLVTSTVSISAPTAVSSSSDSVTPIIPVLAATPVVPATVPVPVIPATPISVTIPVTTTPTSILNATVPSTTLLSPASVPSPVLPIPPPAPIISSTAAAAVESTKSQDIDYRQIFGFQLLQVPPVVPEDESKPVKESNTEELEVIDLDALPSKPRKRKSSENTHLRDRKRKRTESSSSHESVSSESTVASTDSSRQISEVHKISDDEDTKSDPDTETKKTKSDDSFYSQTASNEEKLEPSNLIIMSVSETPSVKSDSPPLFPKFDSNFGASFAEFAPSPSLTPEIPPTDMSVVEMINNDPVRSINIDGVSREIRHYGSTAIVFMNWDDPRDISFFNGMRNVIIDDRFGIPCSLNAPEVETLVYGTKHRFRLGVPTRELYIDGVGYECYFGGPPIKVRLDYKINYIKLEGPAPSVNIGNIKRLDIVAGKISIIINDQHKYPVFLDAKPQYFKISGKPVVLMFIDGLKRVLINNVPFRTDFGGPSQSFKIMNKVYQFRFTVLPLGITPGITLSQMVVTRLPSPPPLPPQFQYSVSDSIPVPSLAVAPAASIPLATDLDPPSNSHPVSSQPAAGGILENISIDELFQKLVASGIVPNIDNKADEEEDAVKIVDFERPETLKQRQPALIKMLYSGIQCGSCGLRFPAEQTLKYSQHLDWHFRLNRKGKDGARTIHSRKWYYGKDDWIRFQEMEDNTDRGTSWFDNHPVTEYTEEILEDVPSIPAGSNQNVACELCKDRFEQFYNDESDEWQLRNAIKADDLIYHPLCYQDHQIKLDQGKLDAEKALEQEKLNQPDPVKTPEKVETTENQMEYDSDSDIEEVELIEEPIEEIIINDDGNDFDDPNLETLNTEDIIAAQQEIVMEDSESIPKPIKIEEPDKIVDITDTGNEPSFDETETVIDSPQTKSGHEGVVTMDGNIELMDSPAQIFSAPIKINIGLNLNSDRANSPRTEESKITDTVENTVQETVPENVIPAIPAVASDEEKLVPVDLKSRVKDARLTVYPPVTKGTEKSGLCSIM